MKVAVTVIVPTLNEEDNIGRCLACLGDFSEIYVVDSGSSDATCELARRFGAKLVEFRWNGVYPKKRNWALENLNICNEWVLFLDADEFVSPKFIDEVRGIIHRNDLVACWLRYNKFFLGQRLKFGVPQRKLALFKKEAARYERIDNGALASWDVEIHEHPQLISGGEVGEVAASIDHQDYKGLAAFIKRHMEYASWEADRWISIDKLGRGGQRTFRQRIKYGALRKWWFPTLYFCLDVFLYLGLLDGRAGVSHAFYKLWYFKTVQLLIEERLGKNVQGRAAAG